MRSIRYLKEADVDQLVQSLLHDKEARRMLNITGAGEHEWFKKANDQWSVTLVSADGDYVCGFVRAAFYSSSNYAMIQEIYVVEKMRGRGVAQELLDFMEAFIFENWPVKEIAGFTLKGSKAAEWKKKRGWKYVGVYKNWANNLDQKAWVLTRRQYEKQR